jgi:hypothetical protein
VRLNELPKASWKISNTAGFQTEVSWFLGEDVTLSFSVVTEVKQLNLKKCLLIAHFLPRHGGVAIFSLSLGDKVHDSFGN